MSSRIRKAVRHVSSSGSSRFASIFLFERKTFTGNVPQRPRKSSRRSEAMGMLILVHKIGERVATCLHFVHLCTAASLLLIIETRQTLTESRRKIKNQEVCTGLMHPPRVLVRVISKTGGRGDWQPATAHLESIALDHRRLTGHSDILSHTRISSGASKFRRHHKTTEAAELKETPSLFSSLTASILTIDVLVSHSFSRSMMT